ncbi:MAG: DsbA family oxidoreductase [Crocinitomicaceae bacterium]
MLKQTTLLLIVSIFIGWNGFSQQENATTKKENKMKIEVWSDIMCPFCYIGKRNYEEALAKFKHADRIELVWKSFQLDPTTPTTKVEQSTYEYLAARKGWSMKECLDIHQSVTKTAKKAGLIYDFDNVKVANSFNAHRIIQLAKTKGLGDAAEEQFFKAHFTDGRDLNDKNELITIASFIGLSEQEVDEALNNQAFADAVHADIQEAAQLGIQGVPFFVMNRKYAVSGAQAPTVFLQTIEKAFEEWQKENPATPFEVIEGKTCKPTGECN